MEGEQHGQACVEFSQRGALYEGLERGGHGRDGQVLYIASCWGGQGEEQQSEKWVLILRGIGFVLYWHVTLLELGETFESGVCS